MSDKSRTSTDSKLDRIEKLVVGVVNGQSAMKSELLTKIEDVHKEVLAFKKETGKNFEEVKKEIKENRNRIDKFGYQLAQLDEDAPTGEEFNELKLEVQKIKQKLAFA